MKYVKELEGSFSSKVELLEDNNKMFWVLKTVPENDIEEIANERYFLKTLKVHGLNFLTTKHTDFLKTNQLLLEYLENSITVGNTKSPEVFELFGKEVFKMHGIIFDNTYKLNKKSELVVVKWKEFIKKELLSGLDRIAKKNIKFTQLELVKIKDIALSLANRPLKNTSLLHCDLHSNNALFTTKPSSRVYLFDKGSSIISGHQYYDLAIILIEFPHLFGLPIISNEDKKLFESFISGYGFNFWELDKQLCLEYTMLRAINRVGTPFNPYLPELIRRIIYW